MAQRMKIAFVGCGAFCSGIHIPNAASNPNFEIVAFCDLDPKRLAEHNDKYHPKYVTADAKEIFQDGQIEAVICATKPDVRMPIMELAVRHHKHLFVEKPLCYSEGEAEPMIRLIQQGGIHFMVGFNRPYSPMMQAVKPLFQRQRAGGNTTIIYRIIGEAQLWPPGHKKAIIENKESTIVHEATHIFDLLNWLTDLEPSRVYVAGGGNMDNIITLTYPQDITAVVISGDNSVSAFPKERLEIDSNHSTIIGENFMQLTAVNVDGRLIEESFGRDKTGKVVHVSLEEKIRQGWAWYQAITPEEKAYGYYYNRPPEVRCSKGHYEELEHFRQSIAANRPPETGVFRGAIAELIAWRAVDSWRSGLPVDLDFSHLKI